MARNVKNKYPADKTGTKYAEFRNTKRVPPGKVRSASSPSKPANTDNAQPAE